MLLEMRGRSSIKKDIKIIYKIYK